MKYFGIMHVYAFDRGHICEEWFIHFAFDSTYNGEEDCTQHDDDYWDGFWKLPNVSYEKICKGYFASPSAWNYIRPLSKVNTEGLHMGKWVKTSPYFRKGTWQRFAA